MIINVLAHRVLDIFGSYPQQPGSWVNVQPFSTDRSYNRWEFTIPVVGFPPGWFHMQNVRTGRLLSHEYAHNRPLLLERPDFMGEVQHRMNWKFQWTLCHSKCFTPSTASERNSWYLINRLTRAPLSPHLGNMKEQDFASREDNLTWKLELDGMRNWKITNRTTSGVLQQTEKTCNATLVRCTNATCTEPGHQSWNLELLGSSSDKSRSPRALVTSSNFAQQTAATPHK